MLRFLKINKSQSAVFYFFSFRCFIGGPRVYNIPHFQAPSFPFWWDRLFLSSCGSEPTRRLLSTSSPTWESYKWSRWNRGDRILTRCVVFAPGRLNADCSVQGIICSWTKLFIRWNICCDFCFALQSISSAQKSSWSVDSSSPVHCAGEEDHVYRLEKPVRFHLTKLVSF